MKQAIEQLNPQPDTLLIDFQLPEVSIPQKGIPTETGYASRLPAPLLWQKYPETG